MNVSSINSNYYQPNFSSLIFHDNAQTIITKGDKIISNEVAKISKRLLQTKDFDMHVKPLYKGATNDIGYFWTQKGNKNSVMEVSIRSYEADTKGNKVGIYAMNPLFDDDFVAVLEYENEVAANEALKSFNTRSVGESLLEDLYIEANKTLALENAKKMSLKSFLGWDVIKEYMPQGEKFSYNYKSPCEIIEKNTLKTETDIKPTSQNEKVHYSLRDRLRILVGLQPKFKIIK